jgi:glycerol-3-phosphate dehydrogenase (NAD(P)+)
MNFVVVGAGAWGTAFALHLSRIGNTVALVPRRTEQAQEIATRRENREYLPGIILPETIHVTASLEAVLPGADVLLLACPAQAVRATSLRIRDAAAARSRFRIVVSLAKGLELGTHLRPSEIMVETLGDVPVGSLSGPTNALGVARGDPSAMVLAVDRAAAAVDDVQVSLSCPTLRVYTSDDLAGVEFGSCLKNIYAIAAGCCDGLQLGDNSKAALLTRALAEMVRVGVALGARPDTFYGLSGFGDLVATSYGGWSRNREFGQQIGEGGDVATLIANRRTVVEGYKTAEAFASLCAGRNIDAPILREIHAILAHGKKPAAALASLMARELKREAGISPAAVSLAR